MGQERTLATSRLGPPILAQELKTGIAAWGFAREQMRPLRQWTESTDEVKDICGDCSEELGDNGDIIRITQTSPRVFTCSSVIHPHCLWSTTTSGSALF